MFVLNISIISNERQFLRAKDLHIEYCHPKERQTTIKIEGLSNYTAVVALRETVTSSYLNYF